MLQWAGFRIVCDRVNCGLRLDGWPFHWPQVVFPYWGLASRRWGYYHSVLGSYDAAFESSRQIGLSDQSWYYAGALFFLIE